MLLPFQLNLAAVEEVCGSLITEDGFQIVTESGDALVTECFTPEPAELVPGRVIKGKYPYWKRPRPYYPQHPQPIPKEDEELMVLAAIEDD